MLRTVVFVIICWLVTLPRLFFMGLIRLYQFFLSPLTGASCRYYPSCSAYGYDAIRIHGVFLGFALTCWRLLRCNPWSKGGVDHVPPRRRPYRFAPHRFALIPTTTCGPTPEKESLAYVVV